MFNNKKITPSLIDNSFYDNENESKSCNHRVVRIKNMYYPQWKTKIFDNYQHKKTDQWLFYRYPQFPFLNIKISFGLAEQAKEFISEQKKIDKEIVWSF